MRRNLLWCSVVLSVNVAIADDDDFLRMVERQAEVYDQVNEQAPVFVGTPNTVAQALAKIRRFSPVAERVYHHLSSDDRAEVNKAIFRGADLHEVARMILNRNRSL